MLEVTFLGHQGWLFSAGGTNVLLDTLLGDCIARAFLWASISVMVALLGRGVVMGLFSGGG